jgi:hypothetical protein
MRASYAVLILLAWIPEFQGTSTPACATEVLQQAKLDGFLKFVILNCMEQAVGPKNLLGGDVLATQVCLARWWLDHVDTPNPIPASGACRKAFLDLVTGLGGLSFGTLGTAPNSYCTYDATTDTLTVTTGCAYAIMFAITRFGIAAGGSILDQVCLSATVSQMARRGAVEAIVAEAMTSLGDPTHTKNPVFTSLADPDTDGGNSLCYACYSRLYNSVLTVDAAVRAQLPPACLPGYTNPLCKHTIFMIDRLTEFKTCSGGYEITSSDPVCTKEQVFAVDSLAWSPYYLSVHCAYHPLEKTCVYIDGYFERVAQVTDANCVICYREFAKLVRSTDHTAECTGPDGVWATECIHANADALGKFYTCAGFMMELKPRN